MFDKDSLSASLYEGRNGSSHGQVVCNIRSSRPEVLCKISILKTSPILQKNTCVRVSFLNKFADLQAETL